jgi:pyruvate dehydrogenase E2 component (dihydrolipoamide acetyltransferase)
MAERIIMPKQGLQMTEGIVTEWLVKEGETVTEGQPFFVIETDKLTIQIDALVSGTLLKIVAQQGAVVPITELIAVVGQPGEDISAMLAADGKAAPVPSVDAASAPRLESAVPGAQAAVPQSQSAGGRVFISPRAKAKAEELGIDWRIMRSSAPDGMIVEKDVLAAKAAGGTAAGQQAAQVSATPLARKTAELAGVDLSRVTGSGARGKIRRADVERSRSGGAAAERKIIPMRGMRKIIAERMKQSQNENAQAFHRIAVRMDEAVRIRLALEKKIGFNDIIAYATTRALCDFPHMNAELVPEGIWQKDFVNLGIAVALDDGLIVPVVKDADRCSLAELAAQIKDLAAKARSGALQSDDYAGGCFTISNLGMYGLEDFMAIINPPEAGILAVGKIEDTPLAVAGEDGVKRMEIHPLMKLTLSYDHRVVDGAPAAQFLARIKEYLENPYRML